MRDLTNNLTDDELLKYRVSGETIEKTNINHIVLIKWLNDYFLANSFPDDKYYKGVIGVLIFFLYENDKISNIEEFESSCSEIISLYQAKINNIQGEIPFKLSRSLRDLIFIARYKEDFINKDVI